MKKKQKTEDEKTAEFLSDTSTGFAKILPGMKVITKAEKMDPSIFAEIELIIDGQVHKLPITTAMYKEGQKRIRESGLTGEALDAETAEIGKEIMEALRRG